MSQIKSFLSLQSFPSQQFKTPPRNMMQSITANHSLSFSNTYRSSDNKSLSNKKTFYQSNAFSKDSNYLAHDFVIQQEQDELQNNSSVTLHPGVTQAELSDFIRTIKMVNFLSKQQQMAKLTIDKKTKIVNKLKNQIAILEQNTKIQKKEYQKKQKKVKSRSLSIKREKRIVSQRMQEQIFQMKLQIRQMKRTISHRATLQTYKKNHSHYSDKRNSFFPGSEKYRKKIYIPISANKYSTYELTDRISRHSNNILQSQPSIPYNAGVGRSNPQNYIRKQQFPQDHHYQKIRIRKSIDQNLKIKNPNQQKTNSNNGRNILALLQQKLTGRQNFIQPIPISSQFPPQVSIPKKSSGSSSDKRNQKSDSSYVKINIFKQKQEEPNLDYLRQTQRQQSIKDEMLMNSQRSKKSIKILKQSTRSISKWKKDQQDQQIVQLLKKSINGQKQIQKINKKEMRSQIGAKIVVTNIRQQNSLDSFSGIGQLPQISRQNKINPINSSDIQIMVDISDEKKNNSSHESNKKSINKSIQRNNIANSQIRIYFNENNESHQQSPIKSQSKGNLLSKPSILKQIVQIQDEGISAPSSLKLTFNLQPSVQSLYTQTNQSPVKTIKSNSQNSQKEGSIPSIPLSRPPSLIQRDQQGDDIIESIKLATNSKYYTPNSRIIHNEQQLIDKQQQDFMNEIRLVGVSRISREKSSSSGVKDSKKQDIGDNESIINQMTVSELSPASNMIQNIDEMDIIDSQLRRSTNSVIIKKGNSAIRRSTNRQKSNLKQSSIRGSQLYGKNIPISIEQAQQEQQQFSNIIRKHNRNKTDNYK